MTGWKKSSSLSYYKRLHGAALLIVVVVIVLAFLTLTVGQFSASFSRSERQTRDAGKLAQIRQQLLAYALNQIPPGELPCPDIDDDGLADNSAGSCQSQLGLLPTRTLQLNTLYDSSSSKFWYAVNTQLVVNANNSKNSSMGGALSLDGVNMVAVVLGPGMAMENQNRNNLLANQFLEGANADGDTTTYTALQSSLVNDIVLGIDSEFFWSSVEQRVVLQVKALLTDYKLACGEYPWAANFRQSPYNSIVNQVQGSLPLDVALPTQWNTGCAVGLSPSPWLQTHWLDQLNYHFCLIANGQCLLVTGDVSRNVRALVVGPGVPINAQDRSANTLSNFYETDNANGDNSYEFRKILNHNVNFNDTGYVIED